MATHLPAAERPADRPLVLVADDDPAVLAVVAAGLRGRGFEVTAACEGRAAIELFHELWEQDASVPSIALIDVRMPGLDGPLVLAALQSLDPEVQAYFMTGDPVPYTADELLACGAWRVFANPLDFATVTAELRRGLVTAGLRPVHRGKG